MGSSVVVLLLTIFLSVSAFPVASEEKGLVVRLPHSSFPASFKEREDWQGMDVDILRVVALKAGVRLVFMDLPFKRAMVEMQRGQVDIMTNLTKNAERSEFMHWLGPVRYTSIALIVRKENIDLPIRSLNDLVDIAYERSQQVAYLIGASYSDELDQRLRADERLIGVIKFVPTHDTYFRMIKRDRVLGFFHDDFEAAAQMEGGAIGGGNTFAGLAIHDFRLPGSEGGAYIGLSKKMPPTLVKKLESAYRNVYLDGTFSSILKKWSGKTPSKVLDEQQSFEVN